jgi:hypothetical protein
MLDPCGYDCALIRRRGQRAFNRGIVTFGAAACKNNLTRIAAEKAGNLLARLADTSANLTAERVHARRVAVKVTEQRLYLFENFLGNFCRGIIIKIYGLHDLLSVIVGLFCGLFVFFDEKLF